MSSRNVSRHQFTSKMPDKQLSMFHTSETLEKEGTKVNPNEKRMNTDGSGRSKVETSKEMMARKFEEAKAEGLDVSILGTEAAERAKGTTGESSARGEKPVKGKGTIEPLSIRRTTLDGQEVDQLANGYHRKAVSDKALPGEPGHIFPVVHEDKADFSTKQHVDENGERLPNGRPDRKPLGPPPTSKRKPVSPWSSDHRPAVAPIVALESPQWTSERARRAPAPTVAPTVALDKPTWRDRRKAKKAKKADERLAKKINDVSGL